MNITRTAFIASVLILGSLFCPRIHAEGTLRGQVTDGYTNSPLPGAIIKIKGPQGVRSMLSDVKGNYWFYGLTPGLYEITWSMDGFGTDLLDCFLVRSGYTLMIDRRLTAGDDKITVKNCGLYLIDKTSSTTGVYISRDMLEKFYR